MRAAVGYFEKTTMKHSAISVDILFQAFRDTLSWQWAAARSATNRQFNEAAVQQAGSGSDLVGYLNTIQPYQVQVLGANEIAYLKSISPSVMERRIAALMPPVIVVADAQSPSAELLHIAETLQIPLFTTTQRAALVIDMLRAYLSRHFAQNDFVHGVFMDILGLGVLITGESGIGKSELGLDLVSRGNGLVADDVVDLLRINQESIEGRCPELLQNLLEVRGIGLLDIRAIFGETAVRRHMRLRMIVHLVRKDTLDNEYERMPTQPLYQDVLGLPIRKVIIQVVAGRNLAVLVEAAVRNCILELRGINTYAEFEARQLAAIQRDSSISCTNTSGSTSN